MRVKAGSSRAAWCDFARPGPPMFSSPTPTLCGRRAIGPALVRIFPALRWVESMLREEHPPARRARRARRRNGSRGGRAAARMIPPPIDATVRQGTARRRDLCRGSRPPPQPVQAASRRHAGFRRSMPGNSQENPLMCNPAPRLSCARGEPALPPISRLHVQSRPGRPPSGPTLAGHLERRIAVIPPGRDTARLRHAPPRYSGG